MPTKQKNESDAAADPKTSSAKYWINELTQALAREADFRKCGKDVLSIYQGEKVKTTPFNILYSNTETLSPALFNQKPRPVVKRRYDDADPVGREVSILLRRALEFMLDDINPSETGFSDAMIAAVTSALLPGRGVTWFRYNAEVERDEQDQPSKVLYEDIEIEEVDWQDFVHGFAKRWRDVPWVGKREPAVTRSEAAKMFGEAVAAELPYKPPAALTTNDGDRTDKEQNIPTSAYVAEVWQLWDKATRQIYWVCKDYPEKILKVEDPPTKFKGFFPCPPPLTLFQKVGDLVPVSLYSLYERQAQEINEMTRRIISLLKVLKVRGAYDSTISDFDKILEQEENKLTPITNAAQLYGQGGGLDKAIWLWPVEKLIPVLQSLYQEREAAKQVLYEITGIADIMRGASVASETLGAQQIKTQWGTLRLKRMQSRVAAYVRGCLRLMAEILAENFNVDTLQRMTNTKFLSQLQKQQIQQVMAIAQQGAQPGAAPQAPPVPPEALDAMKLPSLEEVQSMLQDEVGRTYRIDIESNSTVDVEATEDKEQIGEALNAIAQFMNGVAPMVESGALPMVVAKTILMAICRRFRFGEEVEKAMASIPDQAPPKPAEGGEGPAPSGESPEVIAAQQQADQMKAQTQLLIEQQKQKTIQMEMELREAEHALKMQEIMAKTVSLQRAGAVAAQGHVQKMQAASIPKRPAGQPSGGGSSK